MAKRKDPVKTVRKRGEAKTMKIGRDARTGEFITVGEAKKRPATAVVETVKRGAGSGASIKVGRDARTGEFLPVKEAERRKSTAIVETIKKGAPGRKRGR